MPGVGELGIDGAGACCDILNVSGYPKSRTIVYKRMRYISGRAEQRNLQAHNPGVDEGEADLLGPDGCVHHAGRDEADR